MDMAIPIRPETHFDFGRNWAAFAAELPEGAIDRASEGLDRLGLIDLASKTFLDIGCGSGIHAIAAMRRGAIATGIDVDRASVDTANAIARKVEAPAFAHQRSILDPCISDLGKFDIVYSWGVLHHTGDVWRAIAAAAQLVATGGTLAIALYEETPLCALWTREKRFYTKAGPIKRALVRYPFGIARLLASSVYRRENPVTVLRDYATDRGMDFWRDADDWLGGYPYQPTRAAEVIRFVKAMDFQLVRKNVVRPQLGIFGTGCSEFMFCSSV